MYEQTLFISTFFKLYKKKIKNDVLVKKNKLLLNKSRLTTIRFIIVNDIIIIRVKLN